MPEATKLNCKRRFKNDSRSLKTPSGKRWRITRDTARRRVSFPVSDVLTSIYHGECGNSRNEQKIVLFLQWNPSWQTLLEKTSPTFQLKRRKTRVLWMNFCNQKGTKQVSQATARSAGHALQNSILRNSARPSQISTQNVVWRVTNDNDKKNCGVVVFFSFYYPAWPSKYPQFMFESFFTCGFSFAHLSSSHSAS